MTTISVLPDAASPLSRQTAGEAFADILDGRVPDDVVERFLTDLAVRGETSIEIAAAARAMRERLVPVTAPPGAIDVCGTGGDGHHTLNISTAVALVVAATGVPVAKHGNRAASSLAGAADTLEALGLDMERAAAQAEDTLNTICIGFLFAGRHHPALARIAPIRRRIGRRTIFNLMGPLANPARVTRQLVGIARPDYAPIFAEALEELGVEAALVVAGEDGLDELTPAGPSRIVSLGCISVPPQVAPEDLGLPRHPLEAIRGGDAARNGLRLRQLLAGEPGPYRDTVLLNAAAALVVAGTAPDLVAGVTRAAEAIDDGSALDLLRRWIAWA